jgi:hypothetical protein
MSDHQTNPPQLTRYALEGRIVTMDASFSVFERGTVYVDGGSIVVIV